MGYGILRGQKCKIGDIKGMEIHILRARKSHSNPDINTDKSKDNYAIIALEDKLNAKVARRTEELPGQKTKKGKLRKIQNNAVRMYDFIITGTHEDIIQIDYKNYFLEAVEFMKRKFGEKNVMYAQVHLDERTPHLHLGLVPEYKGKLAAYQLFTPQSMRDLQDEFWEQVSRRYGLERGGDFAETEDISKIDIDKLFDNFNLDENTPVFEEVPKRKHKTAVELKSETLAEVNREKENLERLRRDENARKQRLQDLENKEKQAKIQLEIITTKTNAERERAEKAKVRAKKRKMIEKIRRNRISQLKNEAETIKAEALNERNTILKTIKEEIIPAIVAVDTAMKNGKGVQNAVKGLWVTIKSTVERYPHYFVGVSGQGQIRTKSQKT